MTEPARRGILDARWRTRRRWWSVAAGFAFVLAITGGNELQDWARRNDIGWLDFALSPGLVLAVMVYSLVDRWLTGRRLGGSDQRELYYRALRDGFLPGDDIGDLQRWRTELTRGSRRPGPDVGIAVGAALAGVLVACWYLWPGEPTPSSPLPLALVLLAVVVATVVTLVLDARPTATHTPRLVEAIDLRIAAQQRESARREQQ